MRQHLNEIKGQTTYLTQYLLYVTHERFGSGMHKEPHSGQKIYISNSQETNYMA